MKQRILKEKISVDNFLDAEETTNMTNAGKEKDLVAELCSNLFDNKQGLKSFYNQQNP